MPSWVTFRLVSTSKRFPLRLGCPGGPEPIRCDVRWPARPVGPEAAAADRLGGQHAEQVEVGRFLVLEEVHLQPRVVGPAEHLEAAVRLDQAHRARHLLVDRVRGLRDGGQGQQFGEDRLGRDTVLASGARPGAGASVHGSRARPRSTAGPGSRGPAPGNRSGPGPSVVPHPAPVAAVRARARATRARPSIRSGIRDA